MYNFFMEPVNLEMWNMFEKVKGIGHVECFLATKEMSKGDKMFIHVGGQVSSYKSGIYAVGEIISDPYILHNSPQDYCNEKNTVDVRIDMINYEEPFVDHAECINYINQYRVVHRLAHDKGAELYNRICGIKVDTSYNKKRVDSKKDWIEILKNEKQENNIIIDILLYMMQCKNYTSNGANISKALGINGLPNLDIKRFGQRIVELKNIEEQKGVSGKRRYWNIPFETDFTKNKKGVFTWKLRPELVDALAELYDIEKKDSNNYLFEEAMKDFDPEEYEKSISNLLQIQLEFVKKFNIKKIMEMDLDEYVIGKAKVDTSGSDSFCYVLERQLKELGSMLGATSSKFGIWYAPEEREYKIAKKYGDNIDTVFNTIKSEICNLIAAGLNDDYEKMNKSLLSPMFRGKILATYFPDKYIPIFDEEDIDIFLNLLDINYDVHEIDTIEKKKILLKEYKDNNDLLNKYSDYYFMRLLYYVFKRETKERHTVNGEIDYNIQFVDFNYLGSHEYEKKNVYRSRETDYERISRNKKDIGNRGENAVLNYEKKHLNELGLPELAKKVELSENDAIGYDVISYNPDGTEKHIEVKTNSGQSNKLLDFYLTDNEFQIMKSDPSYNIYYLFSIKKDPKIHVINKEVLEKNKDLYLKPVLYKVAIDVELKSDNK